MLKMMTLMNIVFMLLILCGGMQSIYGEALQCEFRAVASFGTTFYSCSVSVLNNPNDNKIITEHSGNHQSNKTDKDVKQLYISELEIIYIPEGLGSVFNTTALIIQYSKLVGIRSKDFQGMQSLVYLSLWGNKLTSVPSDAFSTLTKLKEIWLGYNQIKYIGSGAFDHQFKLNCVYLSNNICIKNNYEGSLAIIQIKHDIKDNCVEPLSTPTTTTTTTQNPLVDELEALKNELSATSDEMNKLRDDLQKEKLENTKVRMDHQNVQSSNLQLISEVSDMKKVKKERRYLRIKLAKAKKNLSENQLEMIQLNNEYNVLKRNLNESKCEQQNKSFEFETKEQKNKEFMKDKDAWKKEKDTLMINYDALKKEKDVLMINYDALKKEKDALMINYDALMQEKIELSYKTTALTSTLLNHKKSMEFNLICDFQITNGGKYACESRDLTINQKDMNLTEVIGTHLEIKSNEEVTELFIVKSSMSYWSNDIFTTFPELQIIKIQNAQLNELKKGDFNSAYKLNVLVVNANNIEPLGDDVFHGTEENLTEINLNSNQIEKLSAGTFHGLKQLKVLSLKDNLIMEIPLGTFKDIVMLEILILTKNKIKFLDGKMLEFNKRLMALAVDQNKLREVGEEILDYSKMLKDVNFGGNYCIDERTGTDDDDTYGRKINDLIFVIRNCCDNPGKGLNAYHCG